VTKSLDTVIQKDLRIKKVTGVCLKKGFCRIRHLRRPLPAKSGIHYKMATGQE